LIGHSVFIGILAFHLTLFHFSIDVKHG